MPFISILWPWWIFQILLSSFGYSHSSAFYIWTLLYHFNELFTILGRSFSFRTTYGLYMLGLHLFFFSIRFNFVLEVFSLSNHSNLLLSLVLFLLYITFYYNYFLKPFFYYNDFWALMEYRQKFWNELFYYILSFLVYLIFNYSPFLILFNYFFNF